MMLNEDTQEDLLHGKDDDNEDSQHQGHHEWSQNQEGYQESPTQEGYQESPTQDSSTDP